MKSNKRLFRAHRDANGPWWFSSNGNGRFDLIGKQGTCYLADSPEAALRESLGRVVEAGVVDIAELADRVISNVAVSKAMSLADTTSAKAANHGITREISTITPYDLPKAWAAAWADVGFDGIRYAGRFSTSPTHRCYALFGPAGESSEEADPAPIPAATVAATAGIRAVNRPATVTIVPPPV